MSNLFKTEVDELTYNYLACSHPIANSYQETQYEKFTLEDYRFYRKRLYTLLKDRMSSLARTNTIGNKSIEVTDNSDGEYVVFDALVNRIILEGIKIFKVSDYNELQHDDVMSVLNDDTIVSDVSCSSMEDCNKILFLKSKTTTTLDDYVIKKSRVGACSDLSVNYPRQDKFNLKTDSLKKKGIHKK